MIQTNWPRNLLRTGIAVSLALAMLVLTGHLFAAPRVWLDTATGFAIGGYDPVAYHTNKAPTRGREGVEHRWGGSVWKFENSGNRDAFAKHPEIYAPASLRKWRRDRKKVTAAAQANWARLAKELPGMPER